MDKKKGSDGSMVKKKHVLMGGVLVALVESVLSSIEKICGSLVETLGFNHAPDTMKTN
jgi:hypothetical protein